MQQLTAVVLGYERFSAVPELGIVEDVVLQVVRCEDGSRYYTEKHQLESTSEVVVIEVLD